MAEKIIGIDFGTTNSCVAVMEGKRSRSFPTRRATADPQRRRLHRQGRTLVGDPAKRQASPTPADGLFDQAVHGPPA